MKLSDNDALAHRILGETNPKLVRVPGAMENGTTENGTTESAHDQSQCSAQSQCSDTENEPPKKIFVRNIQHTPSPSKIVFRE